jgi:lysozyme family protein
MTHLRAYVTALPESTLRQIVDEFEQFERDGYIGESELRAHATKIMNQLGADGSIVIMMNLVAFEAYRHFANLYFWHGGE